MKCITLTIVCFAVLVKSHRLHFRRLGNHFGGDLGSDYDTNLGSDIERGLDSDASAVANAEAVATGGGTATANAKAVARGSGGANAVAKAVANSRVGGLRPRLQGAASSYEKGTSFGENQYNSGASGAESQGFHNKGRQDYHDHRRHHSSVTKIEHAETSDEHDVGGSESYDEGAHRSSGFNKHDNGASRFMNDMEKAAQQVEATI